MKKYSLIAITIILLTPFAVFAHGEDKAGPNGGFIRMPGAYHTELVPDGRYKLKVYLLNMQWKNPSVTKTKLEISHKGKTFSKAKCSVVDDYYSCIFPETVDLTLEGNLKVLSERDGQKGMEVSYPLPFKFEAAAADKNEHGSHH